MAGDINGDRQLKPEHVAGIEIGQGNQQTRGAAAIRQLVQHGAEACAWKQAKAI